MVTHGDRTSLTDGHDFISHEDVDMYLYYKSFRVANYGLPLDG